MERGGVGFHRYRKHVKQPSASSSVSGIALALQPNNNSTNSNGIANNNVPNNAARNANDSNVSGVQALPPQQPQAGQCFVREQDQYMPIANVIRIMRRILPAYAKISDDAKETIQECVSEYISFITGEANERCQREQRKTITAEDVLWAMGKLGFDDYVEPLTLFLHRHRENENERTTLQNPLLKRNAADYGAPAMPPYMPAFPMGDPQAMYDPAMMGGYYRDPSAAASASSSSQNHLHMTSFDPYAQFK